MNFIGKHYTQEYDCASFVAEWFKVRLGITLPDFRGGKLAQVRWLRNNFTPVDKPVDNCIVYMRTITDKMHVGVYYKGNVYHNNGSGKRGTHGAVVASRLSAIKANFNNIRFGVWSS